MNGPNTKESGSFYGKRGNEFERFLVKLLNDEDKLLALKNGKLAQEGLFSQIIKRLSKDKKVQFKKITEIFATNTVPQLANRGNPKTDICITIKTSSKKNYTETLSLKNTGKSRVSCHDYPAVDFIRVLQCEGTRLADYLILFQKFPSYKGWEANLAEGYSIEEFVQLLLPKSSILTEWALKGMHDPQNLVDANLQISNYLLIRGTDKIAFYSMNEYIAIITERVKSRFGVPFSWTYPSKQRGKRIQLKVPIFFE